MPEIGILQLIVELLVLLLLFYLAFFKSYFQEKGKNLATKEDIEEITSKVESIKSRLQYTLQARLSLREEEHAALVNYYSKYVAWLSAILYWGNVEVSHEDENRLRELRSEMDVTEREFEFATGRMELFVENQEIMEQHTQLRKKTIEFHTHAQTAIFALERLFLEVNLMKVKTPPGELLMSFQELMDRRVETHRIYKEEQLKLYSSLYPLVLKHRRTISAHIKSLIGAAMAVSA